MLDKTDLKQISLIVKNEITDLKVEMNNRFKEQDESITEKFKEQDERITQKFKEQDERITKKFREQDEKIAQKFKEQDERITKEISNQMLVFEEHYGRALTIAVEGLNHRNSNIDIQSRRLENLDEICNLNSAYIYNHEERIHNLEKAN